MEETGNRVIILFIAVIGYKCDAPKFGSGIVYWLLSVLHSFAPLHEYNSILIDRNQIASCLVESKFLTVGGNILGNLREEKT